MYPMSFDVCKTGLTVQAANMGPPPPVKTVIFWVVLEGPWNVTVEVER